MTNLPPASPIATRAKTCVGAFESLSGILYRQPDLQRLPGASEADIIDAFGRFRIWAGNIGALQSFSSKSSLDFRIREAPKIATQINDILDELVESLEDAFSIISNHRKNRTGPVPEKAHEVKNGTQAHDLNASGSDDGDEVSEISEIFISIGDCINNLFRISIIIRNNTNRDRYAKATIAGSSSPFDDSYDIRHVRRKFPALEHGKVWLAIRLGKAITTRRQYLRYCRDHHKKTANEQDEVSAQVRAPESGLLPLPALTVGGSSGLSKPTTTLAPTQASTLLILNSGLNLEEDPAEEIQSQTSYATSREEDSSNSKLHVVPLEDVSKGEKHFECPYCFQIQAITTQKAWKKHVLTDLKPYVCLFEDCELKLFPDRHTWFSHELKDHRREWDCRFCSRQEFQSKNKYKDHLASRHSGAYIEDQLPALFEMSQRGVVKISASECIFCDDWEQRLRAINPHIPLSETLVVTPSQFQHHVGGHQEQLALFAIPRGYTEDDGEADSNVPHSQKSDSMNAEPRIASDVESVHSGGQISLDNHIGEDMRLCEDVLIELMGAGSMADPFMDPLRTSPFGRNLPIISQKLQSGSYSSAADFLADVVGMLQEFQSEDDLVAERCRQLRDLLDSLWRERFAPVLGSVHPSASLSYHGPSPYGPDTPISPTRKGVVHLLALEPMTEEAVLSILPDASIRDVKQTLEIVGNLNTSTNKWELRKHFWKELDVWSYKYDSPEDRQRVIDNAVRQYDKSRLGISKPEWDRLLPRSERGTEKSLSKLQARIAQGSITKAPKINIHSTEDSGRDTPAVTDDDEEGFDGNLSKVEARLRIPLNTETSFENPRSPSAVPNKPQIVPHALLPQKLTKKVHLSELHASDMGAAQIDIGFGFCTVELLFNRKTGAPQFRILVMSEKQPARMLLSYEDPRELCSREQTNKCMSWTDRSKIMMTMDFENSEDCDEVCKVIDYVEQLILEGQIHLNILAQAAPKPMNARPVRVHIDASGSREAVFCHQCENEWYSDEHGLDCPACHGNITEIIAPESDPRSLPKVDSSSVFGSEDEQASPRLLRSDPSRPKETSPDHFSSSDMDEPNRERERRPYDPLERREISNQNTEITEIPKQSWAARAGRRTGFLVGRLQSKLSRPKAAPAAGTTKDTLDICPICRLELKDGDQDTLKLTCEHRLHRACFNPKYLIGLDGIPICPICHHDQYKKREKDLDSERPSSKVDLKASPAQSQRRASLGDEQRPTSIAGNSYLIPQLDGPKKGGPAPSVRGLDKIRARPEAEKDRTGNVDLKTINAAEAPSVQDDEEERELETVRLQKAPADHNEGINTSTETPSIADPQIEVLCNISNARIISFIVSAEREDASTLPWTSKSEKTVAIGPFKIYKAPSSIAFLSCSNALKPILPKTQCWQVDTSESMKFVLQMGNSHYWRIEVPNKSFAEKRQIADLREIFAKVLLFEKTPCPFHQDFTARQSVYIADEVGDHSSITSALRSDVRQVGSLVEYNEDTSAKTSSETRIETSILPAKREGFYMQYLDSLCRRRGWRDPLYETYRSTSGWTCMVLVNGREFATDKTYESEGIAQENAAIHAFNVCRYVSASGEMLARNDVIEETTGLGTNFPNQKTNERRISTSSAQRASPVLSRSNPRTCFFCRVPNVINDDISTWVGEDTRDSPCTHIYHTKCIQPWTDEFGEFCPQCDEDDMDIFARRKLYATAQANEDEVQKRMYETAHKIGNEAIAADIGIANEEKTQSSVHETTRETDNKIDRAVRISCDRCEEEIPSEMSHYHCDVCDDGDFDICQKCFAEGSSCLDQTHELIQTPGFNAIITATIEESETQRRMFAAAHKGPNETATSQI